jgi:hypothetical protein
MQPLRRFVRRGSDTRIGFHQRPSPRPPLVLVPRAPEPETHATALDDDVACRIRPRRGMRWRGRRYARGEIISLPVMAGYMLHLCEVVEMLPGHQMARPEPMLSATVPAVQTVPAVAPPTRLPSEPLAA